MTIEQANNFYIKTANSFFSNETIECFLRAEEINKVISSALIQMAQRMEEYQIMISPALIQIAQITGEIYKAIDPIMLAIGQQTIDFSKTLSPIVNHLANVIDVNRFDFDRFSSVLTDLYDSDDSLKYLDVDEIPEKEINEIERMAEDIISNPMNWEQKLISIYGEIKEKHPLSSKILILILGTLITVLINVTSSAIFETLNKAKLREEPSTTSTIITVVELNQVINIINEIPYYFEVEFTDAETGKTYTGWLSKKSVKPYFEENTDSFQTEDDINE